MPRKQSSATVGSVSVPVFLSVAGMLFTLFVVSMFLFASSVLPPNFTADLPSYVLNGFPFPSSTTTILADGTASTAVNAGGLILDLLVALFVSVAVSLAVVTRQVAPLLILVIVAAVVPVIYFLPAQSGVSSGNVTVMVGAGSGQICDDFGCTTSSRVDSYNQGDQILAKATPSGGASFQYFTFQSGSNSPQTVYGNPYGFSMGTGTRTIKAYFSGGAVITTTSAQTSMTSQTSTVTTPVTTAVTSQTSTTTPPTQTVGLTFYCRNIADLGKDPAGTGNIGQSNGALYFTTGATSLSYGISCLNSPYTANIYQGATLTVWYNLVNSPNGWVPSNTLDLYGVQTLRGPSVSFTVSQNMKIAAYYQPVQMITSSTTQIQTTSQTQTTTTTSTPSSGITVSTSAPNCPYIQPNPPSDMGISGSWASWNPSCLFLPYNQFGGAHFTKHTLTWTVSYVDVDPLHYIPTNSKYTTLWGSLPDGDVRKQNVQVTIQNAFNEWGQAFNAYGKPNYFTFQYVPSLPADIHFYVVRSNDVSPYSYAESYSPYVGAILLQVQGIQAVNLNEAATHELGHILGLGHFCSGSLSGTPQCIIPPPAAVQDTMGYWTYGGVGISTLDVATIVAEYSVWDSGGQVPYTNAYASMPLSSYQILYLTEGGVVGANACVNVVNQPPSDSAIKLPHDKYACLINWPSAPYPI